MICRSGEDYDAPQDRHLTVQDKHQLPYSTLSTGLQRQSSSYGAVLPAFGQDLYGNPRAVPVTLKLQSYGDRLAACNPRPGIGSQEPLTRELELDRGGLFKRQQSLRESVAELPSGSLLHRTQLPTQKGDMRWPGCRDEPAGRLLQPDPRPRYQLYPARQDSSLPELFTGSGPGPPASSTLKEESRWQSYIPRPRSTTAPPPMANSLERAIPFSGNNSATYERGNILKRYHRGG
jgi:hypothetical protein